MKLYNNSQKTPHSESLHKVQRNCKTPRQKMKVYTANITVCGSTFAASDYGRKKHPKTVLREYRGNFHAQKHSSRQSIYTKATRIFLQHQILILYTALFCGKGQLWLVTSKKIWFRRELEKNNCCQRQYVCLSANRAGQCEQGELQVNGFSQSNKFCRAALH